MTIRLSSRGIGEVRAVPNELRGEGGPIDPRLVVPLEIMMQPQELSAQLALTELRCSLHLSTNPQDHNQFGSSVVLNLTGGMPVRSLPTAAMSQRVEVRLPLTGALITEIERHRHADSEKKLRATLRMEATVAWLRYTWNSFPKRPDDQMPPAPFDPNVGMVSELAVFWETKIDPLQLDVPASVWVEQVAPGLGLDRLRLIEIRLPSGDGPLPSQIAELFDGARREHDSGRYRECIQKCRDVRHLIEQHLDAQGKPGSRVADVIAASNHESFGDSQRQFLDGLWQACAALTSSSHHLDPVTTFSAADARTCLLVTAQLVEYITAVLRPRGPKSTPL
ncbi:MAG: hypothetical protein ACRDHX_09995 [Chloroflexota bacterium]